MKVTLRMMPAGIILLAMTHVAVSAACVCVRGTLKTAEVRGLVVATYKQRPEEPIANATIKLMKCFGSDCQTVAEVTSDESGRFSIEGIKNGEYEIVANATHFEQVWVRLKVRGKSAGTKKEIVFGLEPGGDCCAGWAKVRKAKRKSLPEPN